MKIMRLVPLALLPLLVGACDDGPTEPIEPTVFPTPTFSSVGRIAFASTRSVDGPAIYLADPDGSDVTRLVPGEAPAWSPDGTRLAFQTLGLPTGIGIVAADGSFEQILVDEGANPAWSPTGDRIAFDRGGEIHVVNADGTGERLLIGRDSLTVWTQNSDGRVYLGMREPSWSRDGRHLAVVLAPASGSEAIMIVQADGSARVPGTPIIEGFAADFSPDGRQLVVSRYPTEMHLVDIDGSRERPLPFRGTQARWSADGTNIVYSNPPIWACLGPCPSRIFVLDPRDIGEKQLVPNVENPLVYAYADWGVTWTAAGSDAN